MSTVLTDMTPGFRDVVHGAQKTYRTLLDVMSRPGLVLRLPGEALDGLVAPSTIGGGAAAVMLALLDAETSVALDGEYATSAAEAYLRFHTGVRVTSTIESADFTLVAADRLDEALWARLAIGSDEAPQDGATLIVEVGALGSEQAEVRATTLMLAGPGIATETRLPVAGPSSAFWRWRIALQGRLPRGVDLILVCGDRVAALPRSTRVRMVQEKL